MSAFGGTAFMRSASISINISSLIFLHPSPDLMKSCFSCVRLLVCIVVMEIGMVFSGTPDSLFAQPQAAFLLRDTTLQRGSFYRVDLRVALRNFPIEATSAKIILKYTPNLLLPQGASGDASNYFLCPTPETTVNFVNLNQGSIIISCNQLRSRPLDTMRLCTVEFRTLASNDSLAELEVESFTINGVDALLTGSARKNRVTVIGEPRIIPQFSDGIEQSYPNPATFSGVTFPYTLASSSQVQFSIFSLRGEEVYRFPEMRQGQGRFLLKYVPAANLSNGLYSLRMITERGVFRQSFMLAR